MASPQVTGFALAALQYGYAARIKKPERRFWDFKGYVTMEEVHRDELEITDHPIEQGASISDHAFKLPSRLSIKIAWSNSPNNGGLLGGIRGLLSTGSILVSNIMGKGEDQVAAIYAKLLKCQELREPMEVFTGKRTYPNMLIKSLTVTTEPRTENVLEVHVDFQQVIIVTTSTLILQKVPPEQQKDSKITQSVNNAGSKALQAVSNADTGMLQQFIVPR